MSLHPLSLRAPCYITIVITKDIKSRKSTLLSHAHTVQSCTALSQVGLCGHHPSEDTGVFHHPPQRGALCHRVESLILWPLSLIPSIDGVSVSRIVLFQGCYINGITQLVTFWKSAIFIQSDVFEFHAVLNCYLDQELVPFNCWVLCQGTEVLNSVYTRSLTEGRLAYVPFGTSSNKSAREMVYRRLCGHSL